MFPSSLLRFAPKSVTATPSSRISPSRTTFLWPGIPASALRRGLSCSPVEGRLPIDVGAETALSNSAKIREIFVQDDANHATSCWILRRSQGYAFSAHVTPRV